jgi:hypothetical protein
MHLFIDTMDAVLLEFAPDGRVRLENEDWSTPSLQEIRAIIHAAQTEVDELTELIETLGAISK